MKILVVGSGGREHTLVWKIAQSPRVAKVFAAPGNAGTAATAENLNLRPTDIEGLGKAAKEKGVDLVIVGPEAPLASGIVDYFDRLGIPIFGPTQAATQIESSKVFARNLMEKYGIPCPQGAVFSSYSEAREYLRKQRPPFVIKADGLAAGKGVVIANSLAEADKAVGDIMEAKIFGSAGDRVVIDEYLRGREVSLIAFTDGRTVSAMVPACDYKKIGDGDQGSNTGGMGSYSPPGFFSAEMTEKVARDVLLPTVKAMAKEGLPYKGVLYAGLMIDDGEPVVLEFNARFGDPETQVVLPLLKSDLVDILVAVVRGNLDRVKIEWGSEYCVGVVMSSGGYPGSYKTGFPIQGIDSVDKDVLVFHAGTKLGNDGTIYTDGGRVLTVVGVGRDMVEAREKVYRNIPSIHFDGGYYRKDIALREMDGIESKP
ncbi:MAG: phosphoribosylamine--glycine ligase [Dehalococcoidia bacterium]|nr:phosphoribosylamine--glycine ligase [Dehalococcoidia bacterium]MDH4367774.1 phosphoribosylamine--glycine ligase [Dehalococcoidia bacterium]